MAILERGPYKGQEQFSSVPLETPIPYPDLSKRPPKIQRPMTVERDLLSPDMPTLRVPGLRGPEKQIIRTLTWLETQFGSLRELRTLEEAEGVEEEDFDPYRYDFRYFTVELDNGLWIPIHTYHSQGVFYYEFSPSRDGDQIENILTEDVDSGAVYQVDFVPRDAHKEMVARLQEKITVIRDAISDLQHESYRIGQPDWEPDWASQTEPPVVHRESEESE